MTSRPVLVRPVAETAQPGDEPMVIDPAEALGARDARDASDAAPAATGGAAVVERVEAGQGGVPRVEVVVDGWRFVFEVEDAERAELRARAERDRAGIQGGGAPVEIRAIIPGRVVAVTVAEGDDVEAGQPLLVVEAMKMQNELRAPRAGTVRRVVASVGTTIEVGALLVVLA